MGAIRCPDCNKFASLQFDDPEVEDLEIDEDGNVTCQVHIVRSCADCGTELKEATLDMEDTVDIEGHKNSPEPAKESETAEGAENEPAEEQVEHSLEIDEEGIDPIEEGGSRYAKSYFGAEVHYVVRCSCGADWKAEGTMSEKVAASDMDEMI